MAPPPAHAARAARAGRFDAVVVGGGAIGLAAAWLAAGRGLAVAVVDPEPGHGASWAAAGMLAPVTEVHYGEEALLALNLASVRRWPDFARTLEAATGCSVGLRTTGTLLVAAETGDRAWAEDLYRFQVELGLEVQWLAARAARELEPALAPGVRGAVWVPGDHQVHNRHLLRALLQACAASGVQLVRDRVRAVECAGGAVVGVLLSTGRALRAPAVVLAAGWSSGQVGGLPAGTVPPVRPVKGQILRLSPRPGHGGLLTRTVRGIVQGSSVYLVPRADGSVVVGATAEEQGPDRTVTAGAVYQLLRDAHRVVPGVTELVLDEAAAGLRPGSPDNAPLIGTPGPRGPHGLVLATGHYRNGILLTPLTAEAVAALVAGDQPPPEVTPFSPERFAAG